MLTGSTPLAGAFAAQATNAGVDLRPDDERKHLNNLVPGALGGLVLSGSSDVLPRGAQIELVDLASIVLSRGGHPCSSGS